MPKAILDKLPADAKKIYESAWDSAKEKGWDDERAAKYAIGAVKQAGYRKDEASGSWVKLSEPVFIVFGAPVNDGKWIEVACTGDVVDMGGRRLSITQTDFDRWIQAFEANERGQDLPITVDHPKTGGEAAGWFRGLRLGPKREIRGALRDTLLMQPEWTPLGQEKVGNREYRYFSLEIAPGNMLRGGSLVNFPAIKGLRPVTDGVQFSEFYLRELYMAESTKKCPECDAPVPDGSKACPACGAQVEQENPKEEESNSMAEENNTPTAPETPAVEALDLDARLNELQETLETQLAERDQQIATLSDENKSLTTQVDRLAEINELLRLNEKVIDFMQLEEQPSRRIAPAYGDQIVQVCLSAPAVEDEILALLKAFASGEAVIELGERGTSDVPAPLTDAVGRMDLHKRVLKFAEDKQVSYREALVLVSKEGP